MTPADVLENSVRELRLLLDLQRDPDFNRATLRIHLDDILRKYEAAIDDHHRGEVAEREEMERTCPPF